MSIVPRGNIIKEGKERKGGVGLRPLGPKPSLKPRPQGGKGEL